MLNLGHEVSKKASCALLLKIKIIWGLLFYPVSDSRCSQEEFENSFGQGVQVKLGDDEQKLKIQHMKYIRNMNILKNLNK